MKHAITAILILASRHAYSYEPVFYCAYQVDTCIESPAKLPAEEVERLLPLVTAGKENFIGFTDPDGVILQFFVDDIDLNWVEIPSPADKGSFGRHMTGNQVIELIRKIQPPFNRYKTSLGLEFHPW